MTSPAGAGAPGPRFALNAAPLAAHVVALMVAGLILAQLVNLAVVLLLPPPRPPVYRLSEIAAALQGRSLQSAFGRPLLRDDIPDPPKDQSSPPRAREELAGLLGVDPYQIRLSLNKPPIWTVPFRGLMISPQDPRVRRENDRNAPPANEPAPPVASGQPPRLGEPGRDGPGPGGPSGAVGPPPPGDFARGGEPPAGPQRFDPAGFDRPNFESGRFDPGQRPLFGDFTAAWRQPSGRWIVVRPKPTPFPNGWQVRIILWFIGCAAVFSLASYRVARRMIAPIGAFAAAAERLGRDPRGPPMALSGPAELGAAARAFNEMQIRIKRYVEDRTAMVGAISHDLRTPLTRIRFKVEGAEPRLRAEILDDVAQMEAMISAVLVFIRDANAPAKRERLDLLSLIECEVDGAALSGADVALLDADPIIVAADPLGLKRLVGNLIDNAVKYGGGARVSLGVEDGSAVIAVMDEGPGLAEEELERVFQPFYRVEASRNSNTGGTGLGLAVARSIARAHGGDLTLVSRHKGLMAVVRLPLPMAT